MNNFLKSNNQYNSWNFVQSAERNISSPHRITPNLYSKSDLNYSVLERHIPVSSRRRERGLCLPHTQLNESGRCKSVAKKLRGGENNPNGLMEKAYHEGEKFPFVQSEFFHRKSQNQPTKLFTMPEYKYLSAELGD
ncbi:MAG: hypothetical protein OEL87_00095 [Nanoarchaeota archaeon]|nr:hypothetical protein [Nanoarchaeota archaeon]